MPGYRSVLFKRSANSLILMIRMRAAREDGTAWGKTKLPNEDWILILPLSLIQSFLSWVTVVRVG
jgi:hypothetical protein